MNEVAMADKNLSMDRTPQLIAIEINSIKEQARKQMLFSSIEIGRRLTEAKTMLGHGEWGVWLKSYVDYSQSTANNLMRIFTDYGSSQITLFCDNAKSQALGNLSYTQAVALLGIPQEEREAFIQEHDIDDMSTRELQQAIKEAQELKEKLSKVEEDKKTAEDGWTRAKSDVEKEKKRYETLTESYDQLAIRNSEQIETSKSLRGKLNEAQASGNTDEIERLQETLDKSDTELAASLSKIADLERQLKEMPIEITAGEVVERIPEDVERELSELREKNKELEAKEAQPIDTAKIRFKLQFDTLVKGFSDLLSTLDEIKEVDVYKKAIKGLIGKMSERL